LYVFATELDERPGGMRNDLFVISPASCVEWVSGPLIRQVRQHRCNLGSDLSGTVGEQSFVLLLDSTVSSTVAEALDFLPDEV
jgi:hypothetical protein